MEVIDQILSEWSFRCHDGIVDMNDPTKVSILKEILIEEGIEDDIVDAILNLPKDDPSSEEKKQKILSYLTGSDEKDKEKQEEKIKEIEKILKNKDIPEDILDLIVLRSEKRKLITQLDNLINSTTLEELGEKGQLKIDSNLMWINNATATQSSLSLGKGEILLTIMLKDAILAKEDKYDIDYKGKEVEVKQSGRNKYGDPTGAIISKLGRSSNYENVWTSDFKKEYFGPEYKGKLSSWNAIYNKYKQLEPSRRVEFIKDINSLVFSKFKNKLEDSDFKDSLEKLCKKVAYIFAGTYLDNKILIILSSDLQYLILDKETYLKQIITNPDLHANSAFIPRISYKEIIPSSSEEDSKNLSDEESNPPKKISKSPSEKSNKIPFKFKKEDLMKFPSGVGIKSTYDDIEKLKSKGYVSKAPTNTQGKTYYLFKNSKLTIDDLI